MSTHVSRFAMAVAACTLATAADAQIQRKDLSVDTAIVIATTAMADCKSKGFAVSAAVVGRNGEVLVHLRGDNTGPHTMENSFKKAFTSRTFRIPSGDMEERLRKNPQMGAQYLTGFTTGRGALPILIGKEVVGAVGVSGAPDVQRQPRRAASITATSIFFMVNIASNARFASAPPAAIASVKTRGVICQEMPHLSLHQPQALSLPPLPTMAFQ